jgi:tRNA(Ile)-lysidine synthase
MEQISDACRAVFDEFRGQERLFIGFSGGLDSSVLFHALARNAQDSGGRLVAVHINHGLAVASADWQRHCQRVAAESGIAFTAYSLALESGPNLEARARASRYQIFTRLLAQGDLLLLAHHGDDQLESILLHLLQGRGFFGMPKRRELGRGMLLRPLLGTSRRELERYAGCHGLQWIEDDSNMDLTMDRNYLRHEILPGLRQRFDNLGARLERVLRHTRNTQRALVESLALEQNPLQLATLEALSADAAVTVLRHWLGQKTGAAQVSDGALMDYLTQLQAPADRQPVLETPSGSLHRYQGAIFFVGTMQPLEIEYRLNPPCLLKLPHGELIVTPTSENPRGSATETVVGIGAGGSLTVAFAGRLEPATRMAVNGRGRRPRELMRTGGVPPWERDRYPLLFDDTGLLVIPNIAVRDGSRVAQDQDYRVDWQPFG